MEQNVDLDALDALYQKMQLPGDWHIACLSFHQQITAAYQSLSAELRAARAQLAELSAERDRLREALDGAPDADTLRWHRQQLAALDSRALAATPETSLAERDRRVRIETLKEVMEMWKNAEDGPFYHWLTTAIEAGEEPHGR